MQGSAGGPESAGATSRQGVAQASVRAHNLAAVARYVRSTGGCSRRDIGEALGLNKGTVSGLVGELIGRGLLEGGGHRPRGVGRPSRLVQADSRTHASIVVEVLADRAVVSSWTLSLEAVGAHTVGFPAGRPSAGESLARVRDAVARAVGELRGEGRTLTGVVVALPGLVDTSTGELVRSAPLGWQDVPVREVLRKERELAGLPVVLDRVASLATLAESRALPECSDLICLHGGESGLGAGIITGGRILTGVQGRAGELLFPTLRSAPGRPEPDVSALLRRAAGKGGVAHRAESQAPAGPEGSGPEAPADSAGLEGTPPGGAAHPADSAAPAGPAAQAAPANQSDPATRADPLGSRTAGAGGGGAPLDALATALGLRLATLVALLDPRTVVLAGDLAPLTDGLAPLLRSRLHAAWQPHPAPEIPLLPGRYGTESALIGGATMLADRVFTALSPPSEGRP